jgi:hypothetical protein
MITLNSDKGLVVIETWDDVVRRPGFVENLNPQEHSLKAILGRYMLRDSVNCGLSECHTPHGKGYLVLTTDGLETNIGHACGKKYFGVDFETLSRKLDRDITEKNNRELLVTFSFRVDELRSRISLSREGDLGARRLQSLMRPLRVLSAGCPEPVVTNVLRMIKARISAITVSRQVSEEEAQRIEVLNNTTLPRPYEVEERVAELDGLDALFPENDLQILLAQEVEEPLRSFESEDVDLMSFDALRKWVKWTANVERCLDRVEAIVVTARRLLTQRNLTPLDVFIRRDDDKALFKQYLKKLPAG